MAGPFGYAWPVDDVGASATVTVEAGTADATYGVAYLTDFSDQNIAAPALSSSTSGISYQLAFAAPQFLAGMLLWQNVDPGLLIQVSGNASASWGSPAFTRSAVALPKRASGFSRKLCLPLNAAYQYWLVTLPANSTDAPGLKVKALSTIRQLVGFGTPGAGLGGRQIKWGGSQPSHKSVIELSTDFFHRWDYDLGATFRSHTGDLLVTDSDKAALRDWFEVTGRATPVPFIPDLTNPEGWLIRLALTNTQVAGLSSGLVTSTFQPTFTAPNLNGVSLTVEEVTAGEPEWE